MFKQVSILGKGQGLVATALLPVGTTIIEESPLMTIQNGKKDSEGKTSWSLANIVADFRNLTDDQKIQVLSLHDPGPNLHQEFRNLDETEKKVVRIFLANSIDLCSHSEFYVDKCGLYMTISRINHSCAPNVVWSWIQRDKSKSVKQVRVCRKIKEGEEILASYIGGRGTFPSKEDRQMMLRETWNFECSCEVCSLTGVKLLKNEEARRKLTKLDQVQHLKGNAGLFEQALQDAKEKLKVMKTIKQEMVVHIPDVLLDCCELAACCKLQDSNSAELMKKAKDTYEQLGDVFVYGYNNWVKKMKRIQQ